MLEGLFTNNTQEQVDLTIVANEAGKRTVKFRKQILKRGTFVHPQTGNKVTFDDEYFDEVLRAFTEGAIDNVPVITDDHKESYKNTVGRVYDLEKNESGLYSFVEVAEEDVINKIDTELSDGKSLIDEVSVKIEGFVKDDGTNYPAALHHVSIVPHAYFRGMDGFEKLAASLGYTKTEEPKGKGGNKVDNAEILAALKEKGINVDSIEVLQASVNSGSVIDKINAALNPDKPIQDNTGLTAMFESMQSSMKSMEATIADKDQKLEAVLTQYVDDKANRSVDSLIEAGKVVPADKEHFISLFKSDEKLFDGITANLQVAVDTSEQGSNNGDADNPSGKDGEVDLDKEATRLTAKVKSKNDKE